MSAILRGRIVAPALVSIFLAAVALVAVMFFRPGTVGADPRLTLPADQPASGLLYGGLSVGTVSECQGLYRVEGTNLCTHGPDPAPRNVDLSLSTETVTNVAAAATPAIVCDGDGTSGNRLQVLYIRPQSSPDRYAQYLATFRAVVAGVDDILNASAAETGGVRHLRLVTTGGCDVDVTRVTVSDATVTNFGQMVGELGEQGYNRADRKYIIFMEASAYCGLGTINQGDDQPGSGNANNFGPSYARVDSSCWVSFALAHEVMHLLGGVQPSAPHSTGNGHCTDVYDVLCYVDAPGVKLQTLCPANARQDRFDCNHDDYFSTAPPAGSYLATHWNAADNQFLLHTGPAAAASSSPSPSPSANPSPSATSALAVVAASGGTAGVSPQAPHTVGQTVTLTPLAVPGQVFLGWQIAAPGVSAPSTGAISSWATPLTLTLTGTTTVTPLFAPREAFADVDPSDTAAGAIYQLAALGIIRGYGNGNFGTGDQTQRAQMAALIVRAMGWGDENWGNDFSDRGQTSDTLWRNVGTLAHYGVTRGYDGISFGPTDEISQLQVISFITRAMIAKGYWQKVTEDTPGLYANVSFASGHRWDLLAYYRYAGTAPGTNQNQDYAAGTSPATRGWFAQTLWLALDSIYGR